MQSGATSTVERSKAPSASDGPSEETQAERAYRLIEDEIVTLALEPGARLTEQELATRIGLGRTPVREAVQRLVSDGLLVVYPRKGMAVAAINPLEILLALEVRAALERLVAAAAARKASAAQRATLTSIADGLLEAAARGDAGRYMRLDRAFDEAMALASGNPFAVRALAPLQSMARRRGSISGGSRTCRRRPRDTPRWSLRWAVETRRGRARRPTRW